MGANNSNSRCRFYFVAPTQQFQAIWLIVTAVGVAAIAFYAIQIHNLAGKNYQLLLEINSANELKARRDDELREQMSDVWNGNAKRPCLTDKDLPVNLWERKWFSRLQ